MTSRLLAESSALAKPWPLHAPHALVVDEAGYLTYGHDAANVLYHLVNERQIRKRAMILPNKRPNGWGAVLHDDYLAEAIVDRILERGRLLRLGGPSLRTRHLPADELADTSTGRRISGIQAADSGTHAHRRSLVALATHCRRHRRGSRGARVTL